VKRHPVPGVAPPRSPSRCSGLESGSHNFATHTTHRLLCQLLWRERLLSEQPGSRRIAGRGPPFVPQREETVRCIR
jgi:hypothetical protein